jgi:hypothetical protein
MIDVALAFNTRHSRNHRLRTIGVQHARKINNDQGDFNRRLDI